MDTTSRGYKLAILGANTTTNIHTNSNHLFLPKYEVTGGISKHEQNLAMRYYDTLNDNTESPRHINNKKVYIKSDPESVFDETPKKIVSQLNDREEDESLVFYDSGSEYIPSECSSSESEINSIKEETDEVEAKEREELVSPVISIVALTERVPNSKSSPKHYFCIYCKKTYAKLPRHLLQIHRHETLVRQILALPENSTKRKSLFDKIRKQGTFEFNTNAQYNAGQLIVSRRPNPKKQRSPSHYIPCQFCLNYYSKLTIYRHYKNCSTQGTRRRDIQAFGRKINQRLHPRANELMREKICPVLQPGIITDIICFDELIILFGNKLTCKYRQPHLAYHIRQILRTLARFLIVVREINPDITDLKSLYEPRHYDLVIMAVNKLAKLNPLTNEYDTPSLATRLGNYIKKCAYILVTEYIKKAETKKKLLVEDFIKLHVEEYSAYVSKTAIETQIHLKRNKSIELPLHEDVKLLHAYLNDNTTKYYSLLKQSFSKDSWLNLAKCTLILVQIFNRKRAGEIERLLISDFCKRQSIAEDKHSDLFQSLSKLEQILAKRFVKVEIRGKLGRSVPILLSLEQVNIINLLISLRKDALVSDKNPYVFACPGGEDNKFLRACVSLRYFANQCGAKHPENLRGTKLRKQIATIVQILNLQETELGQLASFMGHDLKIHTDHYRLPSTAMQVGQLSKLLIMMEDGNVNDFRGKTLNEINILGTRHNTEKCSEENSNYVLTENINSGEICNIPLESDRDAKCNLENNDIAVLKIKNSGTVRLRTLETIDEDEELIHLTPNKIQSQRQGKLRNLGKEFDEHDANGHTVTSENENLDFHEISEYTSPIKKRKRLVNVSPIGKIKRRTWTTPEKCAARQHFKVHLEDKYLPSGNRCKQVILNEPALQRRTVNQLKAWVNNQINKLN